jgi:hypothetical protein
MVIFSLPTGRLDVLPSNNNIIIIIIIIIIYIKKESYPRNRPWRPTGL